jgi:hypothetical protein
MQPATISLGLVRSGVLGKIDSQIEAGCVRFAAEDEKSAAVMRRIGSRHNASATDEVVPEHEQHSETTSTGDSSYEQPG